MKIGYARVSTNEQFFRAQNDELEKNGCKRVLAERASGIHGSKRPVLEEALKELGRGDTLVVTQIDRLGRSVSDLVSVLAQIHSRGAKLKSLRENVDFSTPAGRLVYHMLGAFAEFQIDVMRERSSAGAKVAKNLGQRMGRPESLTEKQTDHAKILLKSFSADDVARTFNVSKSTLYRHIKKYK